MIDSIIEDSSQKRRSLKESTVYELSSNVSAANRNPYLFENVRSSSGRHNSGEVQFQINENNFDGLLPYKDDGLKSPPNLEN